MKMLRKLKRALSYAIFGYNNEDYDYSFIYTLLEFKLKRMQQALINGVAEHDKATLQSLRVTLRLLNRINTKQYTYFMDQHDKKWGSPILNFESTPDKNYSRLIIERLLVKPGEEPQQRVELIEAMSKDEEQQSRDIRLLHSILTKYSRTWWD